MKTYKIKYKALDRGGKEIKSGTIKVKRSDSEFIAKCRLEDYLKRKLPSMTRMEVIRCTESNPVMDIFEQFM